jgi:hypothetical protein
VLVGRRGSPRTGRGSGAQDSPQRLSMTLRGALLSLPGSWEPEMGARSSLGFRAGVGLESSLVGSGGTQSPRSRPAAARSSANLDRRQNSRASPPGGRTAEHPHRRQSGRASPPASVTPEHLHPPQNARASPPAAERPSISTGLRTPEHLHHPQNARASPLAADRPSISTRLRTPEHLHRPQERPSISTRHRTPEHPHRRQCGRSASRRSPRAPWPGSATVASRERGPTSRRAKSPPPETSSVVLPARTSLHTNGRSGSLRAAQ